MNIELKYQAILYIGIAVALIALVMMFIYKNKSMAKNSVKLANSNLLLEDKFYKRQIIKYYILRVMLIFSIVFMIITTAVLLARPYYIRRIKEQKYNRDIILCMDISSSVDELNVKLVSELQDTVRSLSGERIGIVIFNTTPVVLSPLTDNYEYTIEQLENIKTAIKAQKNALSLKSGDWLYWHEYLYGGTLVGNEMRGSSLIGDGLLGGLFAFPESSEDRTKIIIFSTDNDPQGDSFVSLTEAAEYCKSNGVTVYGIGTKAMYQDDMDEMKEAVRLTGGKFFVEEKASEFYQIVEEIEEKSENLTEGKTIIKLIESPEKYFRWLVIIFIVFVILSLLLRRANVIWTVGVILMSVLLVLTYVYAVIPAKQFSKGPTAEVKRNSNLNVLIVVDNTISMLAKDADNRGTERLTKAKADMCEIIDELEGARFSVISFNNEAVLTAPFNQDTEHTKNAVNSIYPLETFYARGSTLETPKALAVSVLEKMKEDKNQKTALFFISDGEITAEGASLSSYKELAGFVDGGAVLGYGTAEGGIMIPKDRYDGAGGEPQPIQDYDQWPASDAISRIDENNLESIASDIGVAYVNMTPTSSSAELVEAAKLNALMADLKSQISFDDEIIKHESGEEYINPPRYYGFYALVPFAILVLLNAAYVIRRR